MLVNIQTNKFTCEQIASTQEDNWAGIMDRWELYHIFHIQNNGNQFEKKVGRLVEYYGKKYSVFHNMIKYDIDESDIKFENG